MKIKFRDLQTNEKFKHGKSIFVKRSDPFTGTCMGGVRVSGGGYNWLAFDEDKLVERIESNV